MLETIEKDLSCNLEQLSKQLKASKTPDVSAFSQTLFHFFGNEKEREYINILVISRRDPFFAQGYLLTLKNLLCDICIADKKILKTEKDITLVNITFSSLVDILLNCICNTSLTLEETNEMIIGLLQNGYYITLTNRFGIDALNNPFAVQNDRI